MTYVVGFDIVATDYNGFIGTQGTTAYVSQVAVDAAAPCVGAIYGTGFGDRGYGQTLITLASVAVSQVIGSSEWTDMRNALAEVLTSQTGSVPVLIPPTTELASGEIIEAHESSAPTFDSYDFDSQITTADTNRLDVFTPSVLAPSGVITTVRATTWGTGIDSIICEFDITWTTAENCRFFFNTGGEILIDLSHPAGTQQDNSWDTTLSTQLGQVRIAARSTTSTGILGLSSGVGYFDLSGIYTQIINGSNIGDGSYSDNDVFVDALILNVDGTNGDNGDTIRVRVELQDENTETIPANDVVSAGTTCNISVSKNTYLANPTIETPSSTLTTPF